MKVGDFNDHNQVQLTFTLSDGLEIEDQLSTSRVKNAAMPSAAVIYSAAGDEANPIFVRARITRADDQSTMAEILSPRSKFINTNLIGSRLSIASLEGGFSLENYSVRGEEIVDPDSSSVAESLWLRVSPLENASSLPYNDSSQHVRPERVTCHLQILDSPRQPVVVKITETSSDGFRCEVEPSVVGQLAQRFVVMISNRQKLIATKFENFLVLRLPSNSVGARVMLLNWLQSLSNPEGKLMAGDERAVVRLMIDSGHFNDDALRDVVASYAGGNVKWNQDAFASKTKCRLLARDRFGGIIGHSLFVRVSGSVWAAIDNMGSQSYAGSWQADFLNHFVDSMIDIYSGSLPEATIQWTYSISGGVWSRFQTQIEASAPEMILSKEKCGGCYFANLPRTFDFLKAVYKARELDPAARDRADWISLVAQLPKGSQIELGLLTDDTSPLSDFGRDFLEDYAMVYERKYFLLTFGDKPAFLLTFSNFPEWVSLNRGNEWVYLYPLPLAPVSGVKVLHEDQLLALLYETVTVHGGTPFRLGLMSETLEFSAGDRCVNLMIKPDAMKFAASAR